MKLAQLLPDIGSRTLIMGVLNVTPDSFFDKGRFFDKGKAVEHALDMVKAGADIIDIGGESTRPGSDKVNESEEIDRVIPVIEALAGKIKKPLSIDTRKAKVADEALKAGARLINDVSAFRFDTLMASTAAKHDAAVILMHMKGTPKDMQVSPRYKDLVAEILTYLKESIELAVSSGVGRDSIIVDPGIGFGKTLEHNLELLDRLKEFKVLGCPICVGTSRKSFIEKILGSKDPDERLTGTIASGVIAIMNGADILRVHDVKEAVGAARMADSIIKKKLA